MNFKHLSYCAIPFFLHALSVNWDKISQKKIFKQQIPKNDLIQTPQQCYDECFQSH